MKKVLSTALFTCLWDYSVKWKTHLFLFCYISGKGDSFGENFAIDPKKPVVNSNTSVRALTYCEMRTISREDVLHILNQYPLFRENFIKDLEITYNLSGEEEEKVSLQVGFFPFSSSLVPLQLVVLRRNTPFPPSLQFFNHEEFDWSCDLSLIVLAGKFRSVLTSYVVLLHDLSDL